MRIQAVLAMNTTPVCSAPCPGEMATVVRYKNIQRSSENDDMIQWYTREAKEKRRSAGCLEVAGLEESLYPGLVPALDHDMVCESVDNTLGLGDTEFHLKSMAQSINVSVNLLDASQSHVAAAFPQGVDGQFVGRCPGDKVWEVGSDF